jgi:hypothetical protein
VGEQFNERLNRFFGCSDGAFSIVTYRESVVDSQITATGHEKALLEHQFPSIERGSVKRLRDNGVDSTKIFRLYPTGRIIELNLVYPKSQKNELRLYLRNNGFRPEPGLFWFIYVRENESWVGALDTETFDSIKGGAHSSNHRPAVIDVGDSTLQEAIYAPPNDELFQAVTRKIKRNPAIARKVLEASEYVCEIAPDLPTFVSRASGRPYLEVHHVIPISLQPQFELSLDVAKNISILNPLAHRELHHGLYANIEGYIDKMYESRMDFMKSLGLESDDVHKIYAGSADG